jgi:hypothetical protein
MITKIRALIARHRSPGWILGEKGNEVHVLPVNDLVDHTDADCACGPTTEACERDDGSMGWLITHHSLDGRERFEKAS